MNLGGSAWSTRIRHERRRATPETDQNRPSPETAAETALDFGRRGSTGAAVAGLGVAVGIGQVSADHGGDPTIPDVLSYALRSNGWSDLLRERAGVERRGVQRVGGRELQGREVLRPADAPVLHLPALRGHPRPRTVPRHGARRGARLPRRRGDGRLGFSLPDGVYDRADSFVGFAQVVGTSASPRTRGRHLTWRKRNSTRRAAA